MSPARSTLFARLRRSPAAMLLGVWLVVLQSLYTAEHLSARAVAAVDPLGIGAGFLDICHTASDFAAPGTALPSGGPASDTPDDCVLCGAVTASSSAVAVAMVANVTPILQHVQLADWIVTPAPAVHSRLIRFGTVRGPPAVSAFT